MKLSQAATELVLMARVCDLLRLLTKFQTVFGSLKAGLRQLVVKLGMKSEAPDIIVSWKHSQ